MNNKEIVCHIKGKTKIGMSAMSLILTKYMSQVFNKK